MRFRAHPSRAITLFFCNARANSAIDGGFGRILRGPTSAPQIAELPVGHRRRTRGPAPRQANRYYPVSRNQRTHSTLRSIPSTVHTYVPSSGSKKTSTTDVPTDAVAPRIRLVLPSRLMTVIPARAAADSASTVGAFMGNTFGFGNALKYRKLPR